MALPSDSGQYVFTALGNETFERRLLWEAGDPASPVDLTNCAGNMQVRNQSNGALVLAFSTANNTMTFGGAAGTIDLLQSYVTMHQIAEGSYKSDLLITLSDGSVRNLLTSIPFVVTDGVTSL